MKRSKRIKGPEDDCDASLKDVIIIIGDLGYDDDGNPYPISIKYTMDLGTRKKENPTKVTDSFIKYVRKYPGIMDASRLVAEEGEEDE
jgi:hypothetical protein